jgi:hypothetical protein
MDSYQITKPILVALCYVFFLLLLVVAIVPAMTFATLDSSSSSQQPQPGPEMQLPPTSQPQPGPEMQLPPPQPQQNRSSFIEELQERLVGRSPQHLVLNLTEQITFQEDAENTPSPFELTISSDEGSANIVAGETTKAMLTIGLSSGNTQPVTLSCNLTPPSSEGSCNISPPVVSPVGSAELTISTNDTILPGQYTATITATPERGTNRTTNLIVVVDAKPDTIPPVIRLPSTPIQVNASGPSGAQVRYQTSATDDVDGPINNLTCTPSSGSTFPVGETIVECSAVDTAGNNGTGSFTVTIQDTTPPAISVPTEDITAEATSPNGVQIPFEVSSQDDVDGAVEVSCDHNSGETFPIGETVVTCNAIDAAGNNATASFTVIVNPSAPPPDTTPPVITAPTEDITAEVTTIGAEGAEVSFDVSAVDDVDGAVEVSCDHNSGETFPIGETVVTCEATDSSGNPAEKSFNIVVVGPVTDDEDIQPVITVPTTPIEVEATDNAGEEVSYTVTAFDTEDGSLIPQCDPPSGSIFSIGQTIVKCNAVDTAGNFVSEDFPVIVQGPQDGSSLLFIIIPLIIAAIVAIVVIVLLMRRRRMRSRTDVDEGTRFY